MDEKTLEKLEELDPVDKEILRLKYMHRKISYKAIGKLLPNPISLQCVHQRLNKPKVKEAWDMLEKDVIWHIKHAQIKAFQVLNKALDSKDERIAVSAAKTFLDPIFQHCAQLMPSNIDDHALEWDISTTDDEIIDVEVVE